MNHKIYLYKEDISFQLFLHGGILFVDNNSLLINSLIKDVKHNIVCLKMQHASLSIDEVTIFIQADYTGRSKYNPPNNILMKMKMMLVVTIYIMISYIIFNSCSGQKI